MRKNGLKTFFRMGLVLLAMVLLLTPANLCAEQEGIDSKTDLACNTYIWDITGTYDNQFLECPSTIHLVQDAKGKLVGYGQGSCWTYFRDTDVWVEFEYMVKGSIKQKRGKADVKIKIKFKGEADVPEFDLQGLKVKGQESLKAFIDAAEQTIEGMVKYTECIQKGGCEKGTEPLSVDLPAGMDGSWFLTTNNIDDDGKKIMGESILILANGNQLAMTAKGRINARKGEAKVKFSGVKTDPGAKGSSIMATVDEDENVLKMKGKVLGQQIGCK